MRMTCFMKQYIVENFPPIPLYSQEAGNSNFEVLPRSENVVITNTPNLYSIKSIVSYLSFNLKICSLLSSNRLEMINLEVLLLRMYGRR